MEMYEADQIKPIQPITFFDAESIEEAFRFLQKGLHVGKVVVRMPEDPESLPSVPVPIPTVFRSEVSYLLTGGLGGLGQVIATWMVERGAKNLVFLSRSAENINVHGAFFNELKALGCSVQAFPPRDLPSGSSRSESDS
jgi:hypothetical protein